MAEKLSMQRSIAVFLIAASLALTGCASKKPKAEAPAAPSEASANAGGGAGEGSGRHGRHEPGR